MTAEDILNHWGITFAAAGDNTLITGSPNRSESRFLFCDDKGQFYIAEGYASAKKQFQIQQNILLEFLAGKHLAGIYPFCRTLAGEHGVGIARRFWQIRPCIPAEKIDRAVLTANADYGRVWGEFLLQMKDIVEKSESIPQMPNAPFYMSDFFPKLLLHAERKMPDTVASLLAFERQLAPFFKWERQADAMFAHGDFHPGNILTDGNRIKVVIDWEFAGMKFPGYDMALLIGCLAMDHPDNLSSPAVEMLLQTLYNNSFMPESAWEQLPQMIAATRLGWLGEWLTMEDEALVRQETALISILLKC